MSSLQVLSPKLREAKYPVSLDFTPIIKGQAVVNSAVSAINLRDNSVADIVDDLGVTDGKQGVRLRDGVAGESYKVTASVELTDGSKFEQDYHLDVVRNLRPLLILEKQVSEVVDAGVFFASQIRGETLQSVAFLAVDQAGNSVDIVDDRGFQNDLVSFRVRDGAHGQDYTITVFVTTSAGNVYPEQLLVRVRNE